MNTRKMNWIAINERLPKNGEDVWLYGPGNETEGPCCACGYLANKHYATGGPYWEINYSDDVMIPVGDEFTHWAKIEPESRNGLFSSLVRYFGFNSSR